MTDPLLVSALVHALDSDRDLEASAAALARQAESHPKAIDRALAHLLRSVHERPTAVTEWAAETLRLARKLLMPDVDGPPADARAAPPAGQGPDYALGATA